MAGVKLQLPRLPDTYDGRLIRDLVRQLEDAFARIDNRFTHDHTSDTNGGVLTNDVHDGNLIFSGSAQRITGDFSNATLANRVMFQSSTTNGTTTVSTIPNGTAAISGFVAHSAPDPTNSSSANFAVVGASDVRIQAAAFGSGTYLPLTIFTGGAERMRVDTSGNVFIGVQGSAGALELRAMDGVNEGGELTLRGAAANGNVMFDNYAGTWRAFVSGALALQVTAAQHTELGGTLKPKGYTVATLPAAGTVGRMAYVTDAVAPTYLGALTGGGTVKCPVFDNGTAWVAH